MIIYPLALSNRPRTMFYPSKIVGFLVRSYKKLCHTLLYLVGFYAILIFLRFTFCLENYASCYKSLFFFNDYLFESNCHIRSEGATRHIGLVYLTHPHYKMFLRQNKTRPYQIHSPLCMINTSYMTVIL